MIEKGTIHLLQGHEIYTCAWLWCYSSGTILMINRHTDNYHFVADPMTGMTLRWGKTMADNPEWAPVPELADISISNHDRTFLSAVKYDTI
jgi:hypothetical protein